MRRTPEPVIWVSPSRISVAKWGKMQFIASLRIAAGTVAEFRLKKQSNVLTHNKQAVCESTLTESRLRVDLLSLEYDFSKGRRGPVLKVPPPKTRVTIRL